MTTWYLNRVEAERVVVQLIRHSVWFSITPLPDDVWELAVKADTQHVVYPMIQNAYDRRSK